MFTLHSLFIDVKPAAISPVFCLILGTFVSDMAYLHTLKNLLAKSLLHFVQLVQLLRCISSHQGKRDTSFTSVDFRNTIDKVYHSSRLQETLATIN